VKRGVFLSSTLDRNSELSGRFASALPGVLSVLKTHITAMRVGSASTERVNTTTKTVTEGGCFNYSCRNYKNFSLQQFCSLHDVPDIFCAIWYKFPKEQCRSRIHESTRDKEIMMNTSLVKHTDEGM